jgi:hypothetical protein
MEDGRRLDWTGDAAIGAALKEMYPGDYGASRPDGTVEGILVIDRVVFHFKAAAGRTSRSGYTVVLRDECQRCWTGHSLGRLLYERLATPVKATGSAK